MKRVMTIMLLLIGMIGYAQEEFIVIGDQTWMTKNINVGEAIEGSHNQNFDAGTTQKWCYDDQDLNCDIYGGLYTWEMAMGNLEAGIPGVCPEGTHIPTKAEWDALIYYLTSEEFKNIWQTKNDAGTKMKNDEPVITLTPFEAFIAAGGTGNPDPYTLSYYQRKPTKIIGSWNNKYGQKDYEQNKIVQNTNESKFTALATGWREQKSATEFFYNLYGGTNIWTSTEYIDPKAKAKKGKAAVPAAAYMVKMGEQFNGAIVQPTPKYMGLPVRCIKD